MKAVLLVAIGGALGAVARYGVSLFLQRRAGADWPWATLLINVSGCLLIALVLGMSEVRDEVRLLIPVGFIGAYTTFSTYEMEVFRLVQGGSGLLALAYVAASNVLGFGAVLLGIALTRKR